MLFKSWRLFRKFGYFGRGGYTFFFFYYFWTFQAIPHVWFWVRPLWFLALQLVVQLYVRVHLDSVYVLYIAPGTIRDYSSTVSVSGKLL